MSNGNVDIRGQQNYTGSGSVMANIGADYNKALLVTQDMPASAEMSRLGQSWTVGTSTLFAPLTAYPTTTAALEVYNNGTRTFLVSELYAAQILATAAAQTYAIFAMVSTKKAVPSLTAMSVFSNTGKPFLTPTATSEIVTGVGTTVIANGWKPQGPPQAWGTATATPGNAWSVPVDGKLIVPPGCSLCLHVVGALATASTFQVGCSFFINGMTVEA